MASVERDGIKKSASFLKKAFISGCGHLSQSPGASVVNFRSGSAKSLVPGVSARCSASLFPGCHYSASLYLAGTTHLSLFIAPLATTTVWV